MSDKLTKEESAQIEEERSLYWRSIAENLERENAALREDKQRLDWLASETELRIHKAVSGLFIFEHNEIVWPEDKGRLREMIDAARKEAQP